MNIDEDAAKVEIAAEDKLLLAIFGGQQEEIIDFLENSLLPRYARRCAEAMREECAKAVCTYCGSGRLVRTGTYLYNAGELGKFKTEGDYHHCVSHHGKFEWDVPCKAQAIRRVEVKNTRARAKAPGD